MSEGGKADDDVGGQQQPPKNPLEEVKMSDFKFERVLSANLARKIIFALGKFPKLSEENQAILSIENLGFTETSLKPESEELSILNHIDIELDLVNDIYANYFGYAEKSFNKLKVSFIYPATDKHIKKYSEQKFSLVRETPELYEKVVLPYVQSHLEQFSIEWVYNILEHKQEVEKIIYEDLDPDTGFILLPDYKWNGQKETMYLLAIVMDRKLKSLRDLNSSHLPLLENVRTKSLEAIQHKFDLDKHEVRAYFHYQPSFYHLHCHFTYLGYDAPGINCTRSHLLDTVINNVQIMDDYYQKSSITFSTFEHDKLLAAIKKSEEIKSE